MQSPAYCVDRVRDSLVVVLTAPLTRPMVHSITESIQLAAHPRPLNRMILDLQHPEQTNLAILSLVSNIKRLIREGETRFFLTGATLNTIRHLESNGVTSGIEFHASIHEAEELKAPQRGKIRTIDVQFVNPILSATLSTIQAMCGLPVEVARPQLRQELGGQTYEIGGSLLFDCQAFSGSIVIGYEERVLIKVISRIIGEELVALGPETIDGASELLNVIVGAAKRELSQNGFAIRTVAPTLIRQFHSDSSHSIVLPMSTLDGPFWLEISPQARAAEAAA